MSVISDFFVFAFEAMVSFLYFGNKFDPKRKGGVMFAVFAASVLLQCGFYFLSIPNINLITFMVCNFFICLFCYNTKLTQALFNSLLLTAISAASELSMIYLVRAVGGYYIASYTSTDFVLFIMYGTSKLLYFLIAFFISKFSNRETRSDLGLPKTILLITLPVASMVVMLGITRLTMLYDPGKYTSFIFSVAAILLLYANIIVFWVHESSVRAQKKNTELQLQIQKSELDAEYYSLLQNQYDNSGILIHDIKRHLLTVKDMAAENDSTDIIKYIDNLYSEYEVKSIKKYSENKLINAIVNRYAAAFAQENIDFFCDIRNIDFSFISDNDLTAILDNLLENALEASRKSADKKAELLVFSANVNYVVISASNSCAAAPPVKNGRLVTTKNDSSVHGYGIKSIKRVAKNYGGSMSLDYNETQNTFCVKVILQKNRPTR